MRLLFDQNISFRVIKGIQDVFPLAKQVRELGLENYSDRLIWEFAKKEDYTIVTFDFNLTSTIESTECRIDNFFAHLPVQITRPGRCAGPL